MHSRRQVLVSIAAVAASAAMPRAPAATEATSGAATPAGALFAVEFTVGPGWDAAKPPGEQAHFAAHSANLRALRDAGQLVLGARYGDTGLVVLRAADEAEARSWIERDPAVEHGTFAFALNRFSPFYGGCV
ncbi:MAG: YciI family protein [Silanimonas sp.]